MKVIGGYFSTGKNKMNAEQLRSKILSFGPFLDSDFTADSVMIEEYEYGHLFASRKQNVPSMMTAAKTDDGNLFFCLGYFTMHDFEDWDSHLQTYRMPAQLPENFAEQLTAAEGEFNAFYWDGRRRRLNLVNDRFAARPLYIIESRESVFFCTNFPLLLRLAGIPIKFDPLGIMQLLMFLHPVDNFTHVESVKRLRPASQMILSEQGTSCKPYWTLQFDVCHDLDPQEFSREVFAAFRKSVANRARIAQSGTFGLSGGLDSRMIAGCIPEPQRFAVYTVGSHHCEKDLECQCAAEICRVFGFSHRPMVLPPSDLPGFSRKIFILSGNVTGIHAAAKFMRLPVTQSVCRFSGAPGDVMAGGYIPSLYYALPSRTEEYIRNHTRVNAWGISRMQQFLSAPLIETYIPKMNAVLETTYATVSGPTAAHKITGWKMVHYNPAFSCSGPFNSHPGVCGFSPHLGYAYNDLMLKLPALWLYQKAFYKYMIYQNLPEIRHVCYANTGEMLSDYIPAAQLPLIYYKFWALRRRLKSLLTTKEAIQPQQAFEFYVMQKNEKLWTDMEEIIASYPELNTYFNIPAVRDYVTGFKELQPRDQMEAQEYVRISSFVTAVLYFYKYIHELM